MAYRRRAACGTEHSLLDLLAGTPARLRAPSADLVCATRHLLMDATLKGAEGITSRLGYPDYNGTLLAAVATR